MRHSQFYSSPTVVSAIPYPPGRRSTYGIASLTETLALLAEDLPNALTIEQLGDSLRDSFAYRATTADRVYARALAELLWTGLEHNGCQGDRLLWQRLANTLLRSAIYQSVQRAGLDPHLGIATGNVETRTKVLPDDLPLVSDFAAELAPLFADSLAVSFCTASMQYGNRNVHARNCAIASFIANWERQWDAEIVHPRAGTLTYRQCLEFQIREYLAWVLGDADCYRPMLAIGDIVPLSGGHGSAVSLQSKPQTLHRWRPYTPQGFGSPLPKGG